MTGEVLDAHHAPASVENDATRTPSSVRIAFPFVGDLIGGSHLSTLGLIKNLDRTRYEPIVFVQNKRGAIAALFEREGVACEEVTDVPDLVHGRHLRPSDLFHLISSLWPTCRALRSRKISIVHTNDGRTHAAWSLAAKLAGASLVWHHRSKADALGLRYVAPLLADQVISVSEYSLSKSSFFRGRSGTVIHSPFDTHARYDARAVRQSLCTEIGCPPKARLVAFSGALIGRKRPFMFIEAIAQARRMRPHLEIHGLIFGEEIDYTAAQLTAHAVQKEVAQAVHLLGYRTPGPRWLAGCDALLVPAIDEPFGRTLIEAMLVGVPVIATRSGGNAEALRGGSLGMLVSPDRPLEMAAALVELFDQPSLSTEIRKRARVDACARFGEQRHAEQVMGLYDKLLG